MWWSKKFNLKEQLEEDFPMPIPELMKDMLGEIEEHNPNKIYLEGESALVAGHHMVVVAKQTSGERVQDWVSYYSISKEHRPEIPVNIPEMKKAPESESKAMRYNEGKVQLNFILQGDIANEGLARVMEFGAKKYERGNWLKGHDPIEVQDSLLRHLMAYNNGEILDPESGLPHIDHIQFNAKALAQFGVRNA